MCGTLPARCSPIGSANDHAAQHPLPLQAMAPPDGRGRLLFIEAPRRPAGDRGDASAIDPGDGVLHLRKPEEKLVPTVQDPVTLGDRIDLAPLAAMEEQLDFMRSRHEHGVLDDDLPHPLVDTDSSAMFDRIGQMRVTVVPALEDVAII